MSTTATATMPTPIHWTGSSRSPSSSEPAATAEHRDQVEGLDRPATRVPSAARSGRTSRPPRVVEDAGGVALARPSGVSRDRRSSPPKHRRRARRSRPKPGAYACWARTTCAGRVRRLRRSVGRRSCTPHNIRCRSASACGPRPLAATAHQVSARISKRHPLPDARRRGDKATGRAVICHLAENTPASTRIKGGSRPRAGPAGSPRSGQSGEAERVGDPGLRTPSLARIGGLCRAAQPRSAGAHQDDGEPRGSPRAGAAAG